MAIAALIMAAGQSSRFNGCKLLARLNNESMLQLAINKISALGIDNIFIITGAWHDDILQAQKKGEITGGKILHNSDWAEGLGCSIAYGVSAIADKYDAILITLADQVAITTAHLSQLLVEHNTRPHNKEAIVCATYQGKRGVPAIFPKNCFAHLMTLSGDQGAKKLLSMSSFCLIECDIPLAAVDIDTQQEFLCWQKSTE